MKMTLIPQASAAALLLVLPLCLQCAGVAALVEWLRGVTAKSAQGFGPVRSAILVVKTTIAIIILHGLVILLWASFYRLQCFPSWELAFYFSSSSYATVGYGDVTLPSTWRLLASCRIHAREYGKHLTSLYTFPLRPNASARAVCGTGGDLEDAQFSRVHRRR